MNFSLNSSTTYDSQRLERLANGSFFLFDENSSFDFNTNPLDFYEIFDENSSLLSRKSPLNFCCLCTKLFISENGLNYHTNMYHPTQSVVCSDCQMTFRSHRALKIHKQRSHSSITPTLNNYNYLSSYLVVAFSSDVFPVICANACLEKRLPLGALSSKYFHCSSCDLSFPCARTLKYHELNHHSIIQQNQDPQIDQTDEQNEEFRSCRDNLSELAPYLGLTPKNIAINKHRQNQLNNSQIYPKCSHPGRTCANLCLNFLPDYDKHLQRYTYKIVLVPKGNPFSQGSIVSKVQIRSLPIESTSSPNPKRKSMKRIGSSMSDISSSIPTKKKLMEPNSKLHETSSSKPMIGNTKKVPTKTGQLQTRSFSSSNLSSKRSRSPVISLAVERAAEKRRRQREQRKVHRDSSPLSVELNTNDNNFDVEQENGDDDILINRSHKPKQRHDSTGSVEYIQTLNNESQNNASLNNIENVKKDSPPSPKKLKTPTTNAPIQAIDDEHIRVRCKVCGDILEGRSLFSKHVLTVHSHLVNKTINSRQQQTAVVR